MPTDFSADRYNWPCNRSIAKEDQKEIKEDLEAFQ